MTKAFMVYFKDQATNFIGCFTSSNLFGGYQTQSTPFTQSQRDDRPILVIAKSIDAAAAKYKNAVNIQELDIKDVIIDENVDIILEKRR
ncbi:MAG: hypothetical protein A3K77_01395 [Euryarchaeota archaeon RBG_13_31_8]|nr:MAG: hypothetical protein A3K77_01395 [Euryarchaeota archaeon RBG_13_31_8]